MPKALHLITIDHVLEILQDDYFKFRKLDAENQSMTVEYNQLVRQTLEKPELSLRTLYIDLGFHDEMIRSSMNAHDMDKARIELIMKNKIAIEQMIRAREEVKESVIPETKVDLIAQQVGGDINMLKSELVKWFPPGRQASFSKFLQRIWKKSHNNIEEIIKAIVRQCIVVGMKSIDDFRLLVDIVECLTRFRELN